MTDVEIFEQRTPMLMVESVIRRGSGGRGIYNGGKASHPVIPSEG
jgi:5-oxoprolinase (ATP-hydrolysing)